MLAVVSAPSSMVIFIYVATATRYVGKKPVELG